MSEHYFLNFPVINYAGLAATNIMSRAIFLDRYKNNSALFYDYTVPSGDRPEKVANDLYGSPAYCWMIYLFNDIFDIHYDWPLNEQDLLAVIYSKYGTIDKAQQLYVNYRSNWFDDSTTLNPATFEALPADLKKYWRPNIVTGNRVLNYTRSPLDVTVSTNQIASGNCINDFTVGAFANSGGAVGQIIFANSSFLAVNHIRGTFSNAVSVSSNGSTNGTWTSAISLVNVIPVDEQVYYSPLTSYDQIYEANEAKRQIKLIRPELITTVEKSLRKELFG